ncbi:MAG: YgjV family protein [Treponema sp.]|nr:YgjV family protein [Treponema sp.]
MVDSKIILEAVGYIGSAFVVISMLMTSVVKLRLINAAGSVISIIYAAIVGAYPLAVMNFCLVIINTVNLIKLFKSKKDYSIIKVTSGDAYLKYFIDSYRDDIASFFPDADIYASYPDSYIICRGSESVGIMLGKEKDGTVEVRVDYATPMYRDCSVGKFLYSALSRSGVRKLSVNSPSEMHKVYLKKMGFINSGIAYEKLL